MKRKPYRAVKVLGKWLVAALPIVFVSIGCKKEEEVRAFQTPKDIPTESAAATESDTPGPDASGELGFPGELRWKLPADWKQVAPPPARMGIRAAAAIQVFPDNPKLLLTMSRLPANPQIVKANVDRWCDMVNLPSPTPDDMKKVMTHREVGDVTIAVIDLDNPAAPPLRLLGAIIVNGDGSQIWAMKVTGPADQITAQKSRFDEFLGSIQFANSAAPPTAPEAPAEVTTGTQGVTWTLPTGWTAEPGTPRSGRVATIHPGGNGATEIKVSKFDRVGGGLGANVTRWRGDVGLGAVSDEEADPGQKVTLGETAFTVHDYTGPARGGTREVIALTELNGATWYFKLTGPTEAISGHKPAFDQFLTSLRFAQ